MKCLLTKTINNNSKIKGKQFVSELLKALVWPFLFVLISYLINFIFSFIYFYNHQNTSPKELSNYLNDNSLLMVLIIFIIFFPILFKKYQKISLQPSQLKIKNIISLIIIGSSLAVILNIIIYNLDKIIDLTERYDNINNKIMISLITTGILGPILEEYLFRGVLYNKLKKFNSRKKAMILTSIVFAIMHFEITQMFYGFIFSLVLTKIYEHYQNLKAPIITHISANSFIILNLNKIINLNILTTVIVLIVCLIINYLLLNKYYNLTLNRHNLKSFD